MEMEAVRCVLVGDAAVGKTCLLMSFTKNVFPEVFVPTVCDNYSAEITVDSTPITVNVWDTAGAEDYDQLRTISYTQSDVCIMCFSISRPASFENIKHKWCPEVSKHCPNVPFLLVGTQMENREDPTVLENLKEQNLTPVTKQQGEALAQEIGAIKYLECSAQKHVGVKEVFTEAVRAFLNANPVPQKRCMLM